MRAWCGLALASSVPFAMIACGLDDTAIIGAHATGVSDGSAGGDGTIGSGESGSGSGGGDSGAGVDTGASGDAGADSGPSSKLVYANTTTDLWSYEVVSNVLTKLVAIGCPGHPADLAIDGSGQAYIDEANDAVYKIALTTGMCTSRNVLDAFAGDAIHITARAAGTPGFLAVDPQNNKLLGLDPSSAGNAHIASVVDGYFADNAPSDIVCNAAGGCWTALPHTNCSSGSGTTCLYSFPADGSSAPLSRGAVAVVPMGLAFANAALYAFGDDGRIYQINTSGTPTATEKVPAQIVGAAAEPASWAGAASSSSY